MKFKKDNLFRNNIVFQISFFLCFLIINLKCVPGPEKQQFLSKNERPEIRPEEEVQQIPPVRKTTHYSQWNKGFPPDQTFFPIAVWLQSAGNAQNYKNLGINIYVALNNGPTESQFATLREKGMYAVVSQNVIGLTSVKNDVIRSWFHQDEPDNAQPIPNTSPIAYGDCVPPQVVVELYKAWKAKDPTRPILLNFGQGVSFIGWHGRGDLRNIGGKDYSVAGGHYSDYYKEASAGADIVGFDIYPVTSIETEVKGKLEYVAKGVKNLVKWTGGKKIVWNCIETTHIDNPKVRPTADQIKSEVWMSIIAGSMGIIYFCHEFVPRFREDGLFNYPEIVDAIGELNAQITSLAPVLNSPNIQNQVQVTSSNANVPIDFMVKQYNGKTYIFAAAIRNSNVTGTFTVNGTSSGTAEVLNENRQIGMSGGSFQDDFTGYGIHVYEFKIINY